VLTGGPERGEIAGIEGSAAGSGDQLRAEEHQEQRRRAAGVGQGHVRLGVVDDEDVARLDGLLAPPEPEPPPPLDTQCDLEVLVPVHPVGVAVGPVVDDGQRKVRIEVLRPEEEGHAWTVRRTGPSPTGPQVPKGSPGCPGSRF
jgi:hypothetical protein